MRILTDDPTALRNATRGALIVGRPGSAVPASTPSVCTRPDAEDPPPPPPIPPPEPDYDLVYQDPGGSQQVRLIAQGGGTWSAPAPGHGTVTLSAPGGSWQLYFDGDSQTLTLDVPPGPLGHYTNHGFPVTVTQADVLTVP